MGTRKKQRKVYSNWEKLISDIESPEFNLTDYVPEETAATILSSISEDPRLRQQQMAAMDQFGDIAAQGGRDAMFDAQMNQLSRDLAARQRAQRAAIQQQAAMRGVGGSGLELAQQLAAQQTGAQTASDQGFNAAAEAQRRALQAIQAGANIAGNVRGQDYGIASERAKAQDIINQANVQNRNVAQLRNLDEGNKLRQQQYQNQLAKAGLQVPLYQQKLEDLNRRKERVSQNVGSALEFTGGLVDSIGGLVGGK